MIEGALTSLINSILSGSVAATGAVKPKKEDKPKAKVLESEPETKEDKAESQSLSKEEKDEIEYLLLVGGLTTPQVKQALSGDTIPRKWLKDLDRGTLKQIAEIAGVNDYSNLIYDGEKLGKGYTSIPLTKRNKPKTETVPLEEGKNKDTSIKGEKAKDKTYTTKGEEAKNKSTVMEIPEEDLDRLIAKAEYNLDAEEVKLTAIRLGVPLKVVQDALRARLNEKHQKALEDDLRKQTAKEGKVSYDNKLKDPKYKEATEKAAEKYKAETPDYKYDDVKRSKEAKGEKYTGERYSGKPSEEALRKADDFVTENAGRDYDARLDRAKNKTSIYRSGK